MSTSPPGRPRGERITARSVSQRPPRKTASADEQLARQTRKLLGKHWANKYRHGRG